MREAGEIERNSGKGIVSGGLRRCPHGFRVHCRRRWRMAATEPPLNPISAWLIVIARIVEGLGENLRNVRYPPGSWDPRDGDPLIPDPPPAPEIPDPVGERNRRLIPQAVKIAV